MEDKQSSAKTFEQAFFEMQQEIPHINKSGVNTYHNNSPYAQLPDIREVLLPILNKHNFTIKQYPVAGETHDNWWLVTHLFHISSNTSEIYHHPFNCKDMSNPQVFGSAETYACRYALTHIFFLILNDPTDDDGNKAAGIDNTSSDNKKSAAPKAAANFKPPASIKPRSTGIGPSPKQIAAVFRMAAFKDIPEDVVRDKIMKQFNAPIETLDKESFQKVFDHYKDL